MSTSHEILGNWVYKVLVDHFKEQRDANTNKLFIKINGLNDNNINSLLFVLNEMESELSSYYNPTIRTIKPVKGFEKYSLKDFETSTWLRNYTFNNAALVMIINEITPEAQSLENLFSIDEGYLLSDAGLEKLYSILSKNYDLAVEEIEILKEFLNMYSVLTEPQLRFILKFIEKILTQDSPSITEKIKLNLPELNLFVDSELLVNSKGLKRLRANYYLSNLQKPNGNLDPEKLQTNLYSFLEINERNEFADELWDRVDPKEFEISMNDFLNQKNIKALKYEFSLVESAINFKVKTTIQEKLREALIYNSPNISKEQEVLIEEGIQEVEKNQNPDAIQDFLDKHEEKLVEYGRLDKVISKRIEKLRHPKDYNDLVNALQYEMFSLIDEYKVESDALFKLIIINNKLNEEVIEKLKIYLSGISDVLNVLKFEEEQFNKIQIDESATTEVSFRLSLISNGEVVGSELFKVRGFSELELLVFKDSILNGVIPYLRNFQGEEVNLIDIQQEVYDRIQGYLSINQPGIQEHYEEFMRFLMFLKEIFNKILTKGIFSIEVDTLKKEVESVLSGVNSSVEVATHIYRYINYIGAIDILDVKVDQKGFAHERKLTILNPIRLISYISRFEVLNHQVSEWIDRSINNDLEVSNLEEYLQHINEKTLNLSPRYFASDGDDAFLIEVNEVLGEGQFVLNTKQSENMDYLSSELSEELVKSVKNYFEVYPYAKDGLDILFLYCRSAEVVTKSIDSLFKQHKGLNKLKITVHSTQAAIIHQRVNQWIKQKEEYTNPDKYGKFPIVEVNIISGDTINEIESQIKAHMIDADLVILADYFGQSDQVKYEYDRIEYQNSPHWFNHVTNEPLLETEQLKRISYVSEQLPETMKSFYQLQYIFQKKEMLGKEELFVLKNKISLSNFSDNVLIDYMHDNFNWIMFMDRYLDKSLLEKASSKAQIIHYKSKAGANKNFKLIVSSSEYIKKLNSNANDYEYYDRLTNKLSLILKSENISKDKVKDAVGYVKAISGALVLKAIGPGKFSHEMIATYLSVKHRKKSNQLFQIWSTCDELPWFNSNKRRPDLVITTLQEENEKIILDFELLELKFVSQTIFDKERYDAIKQIEAGKKRYEDLFDFSQNKTDAEYWKNELIHYLIEKQTYNPQEAYLIKKLQQTPIQNITVRIQTSIDSYCYTSNLYENSYEQLEENVYRDYLDGEFVNNIFNRTYILGQLGAKDNVVPNYAELVNVEESFSESLSSKEESGISESNGGNDNNSVNKQINVGDDKARLSKDENCPKDEEDAELDSPTVVVLPPKEVEYVYPEEVALRDIESREEEQGADQSHLKKKYVSKVETNFNQLGMNVRVNDIIVGSSVIRLNLSFPKSIKPEKVMMMKSSIQLWLGLDQEPNMFIDKHGFNIDIVREEPDTIYFEEFMKIARVQLNDKIEKSNLIAPLGFDPLNNVIFIDLSDPSTPHLLTGGTTGSGKSVTLNSIILGMMCFYKPFDLQFVFIDPKQVEFSIYENMPYTQSVVTSINQAVLTLDLLVNEMEKRYGLFKEEFASNLEEYISITGTSLPRIVVVFDEFADFMSQEKEIAKQVENAVLRLGQKARAAGIHLIICTQNPKSDIINTNIRNNLGARLALRATDSVASSVILGESGAENLGGKGDFLAKTSSQKVTRGKSPFLTPQVKRALLKHFMTY